MYWHVYTHGGFMGAQDPVLGVSPIEIRTTETLMIYNILIQIHTYSISRLLMLGSVPRKHSRGTRPEAASQNKAIYISLSLSQYIYIYIYIYMYIFTHTHALIHTNTNKYIYIYIYIYNKIAQQTSAGGTVRTAANVADWVQLSYQDHMNQSPFSYQDRVSQDPFGPWSLVDATLGASLYGYTYIYIYI